MATAAQVEEDIDTEPQILIKAEDAKPEIYLDTPVEKVCALAEKHGWETRMGYSKSFTEGGTIKTGDNAGQSHPDVTREQLWLLARKQGSGTIEIMYARRNGGKWVREWGARRGVLHMMSDTEMKEYIKV
jgi:hypothetical protein